MALTLSFDPGLSRQFRNLRDVLTAAVYESRGGPTTVAMVLGMTLPELTRALSGSEGHKCDVSLLPQIVRSTHDLRPVYWLVETFCEDADAQRDRTLDRLSDLMGEIPRLLDEPGIREELSSRRKRRAK